jgi:D-alanyl-lipoteichoic acid acyltransferase DltB (MBOAT superfamily)
LGLILFSVAVTWISGILMEGRTSEYKKIVVASSLILNLAVLFFFKYYNFFAGTMNSLFVSSGRGANSALPALNVLLPVGISFYTFQALGYSIDVYRGTVTAERNFLTYGLFVTFFPQLVAGPIERSGNLLPQFKIDHEFDYDRVTSGLKLAAWGMFKKVVIADRLAIYVNGVYGNPGVYPACALLLATLFFTFQIYCDFSGYSDIAIGTARVLGFKLMTNFRSPYFSRSVTEFWRRWHISLSTWLKDYIYIPLGGNRKGPFRQ